MKRVFTCGCFLLAICSISLIAQEPLTNETILKLVKAGIGEETIVGMVNQQPGPGPDRPSTVPKLKPPSFAWRFNFASASRFICSFICEYFLNTFASPCLSNRVTHGCGYFGTTVQSAGYSRC